MSAKWFANFERWRTLSIQVPRELPDNEVVPCLAENGTLCESLFAVTRIADVQLALTVHAATTDAEALAALTSAGWRHECASGVNNNCLADALLRLLLLHKVLRIALDGRLLAPADRQAACQENRKRLCMVEHLRPRNIHGHANATVYLQHDVHADHTIRYFIEEYGAADDLPQEGIKLLAHTRYDTYIGVLCCGQEYRDAERATARTAPVQQDRRWAAGLPLRRSRP